jgi:polar amino acid transport system substrate-binding protein
MSDRKKLGIIVLAAALCALGVVLLSACGGEEPTTVPDVATTIASATYTEAPAATSTTAPLATSTPTPAAAIDDSWDRIQAAGKIVVGTAADYPPFEYWTKNHEIDGFDIALMDEIGDILGVEVEYVDMAFEGLGDSLQLGEIDIAVAAISITPEREALYGFSNVYLVSEDGILAQPDSGINIDELGDLSQYRIGVQRGTVHEQWLREELIDAGLLPSDNLFVYADAADLSRDLTMNRLDLAMMDIQPALVAVREEGVELVGQGLNQMRLAIALPKGAHALKAELDDTLTWLNNQGVIASLSNLYLGQAELLPTPTPKPTSTPGPTSTPPPPPACVDGLKFLQHPPGDPNNTQRPPDQTFTKVWRVQNSGTCTWNSSYRVVHIDGAKLGGGSANAMGTVAPGQTYDIAVQLVAPTNPGNYHGRWQMENSKGKAFGERLPVQITVPAQPTITPAPTQPPVAGIEFTVDRTQITAGECVWFSWRVSNVQAVYFYAEGQRWQDGGVTGQDSRQECPPSTTTYYLRVVKLDGSVETRQFTISVAPAVAKPLIDHFSVEPPTQITLGQCVIVRWKVSGDVDVVRIFVNDQRVWDRAPIEGNYQHCPESTGTFGYAMSANGPGGRSERNQRVQVVQ